MKGPHRKPRAITGIHVEEEDHPPLPAVAAARPLPAPRVLRLGGVLLAALTGLVILWASSAAVALVEDLFNRSPVLGWTASALAAIAALSLLGLIFREIWGLARLRRIAHIQEEAIRALNAGNEPAAKAALRAMRELYAGRHDTAWGLDRLKSHDRDIMPPIERLKLASRLVVAPLDEHAHRLIARAARRVTLLTTVTPAAAFDVLIVAYQNLRMLRDVSTLYGGRPSAIATIRLARMVGTHLAVTGGLALSDNLLQHLLGRGILGRFSARFGEGAVNGILTARIGLAACDVCRPVPQDTSGRETLASLLREIVTLNEGPKTDDSYGQSQS